MIHTVQCVKLKKEAAGLTNPPLPGKLGEKIYKQISHEAWQLWLSHQTMLINEYRLSMIDPKARTFLLQEMENFLFGSGSNKPSGYVPKNESST
jgi:Fe-S cluster biosynthesis and repair protein YggX